MWAGDLASEFAESPDHTDLESLRDPRLFSYSGNTGEKPHWAFQMSVYKWFKKLWKFRLASFFRRWRYLDGAIYNHNIWWLKNYLTYTD